MNYMINGSMYEDTSLDSPGNLYAKIRKITDMNVMANFIMDHRKNIPRYVDVISDTIGKIVSDNRSLHVNMVQVMCAEAIKYIQEVDKPKNPEVSEGYIHNGDDETNYLAYIKILSVYAEWLFRGASKPILCQMCGDNSTNRYPLAHTNHYTRDSRMHLLVHRTYIPMLLLLTSPKIIDDYCEIADPSAKKYLLWLVCGTNEFVDVDTQMTDIDKIIDELSNILPPVSVIVGNMTTSFEEELREKVDLIVKQNYIGATTEYTFNNVFSSILNYIRTIRNIFREIDESGRLWNTSIILYNCKYEFEDGMRKDMSEALGSRHYGDDAYLIFKEVPHIYYHNSLNPDSDSWKEEADLASARLVTFAKMLSNVYHTDNKINEAYVRAALHQINDDRKDFQEYVQKEYDKKCKSITELDESIVDELSKHRWIFFDDSEEEFDEEDELAFESRLSRKARRTVRRDKAFRGAYNKFHELDTRINKADSTITKFFHGLKNLVMGDTRSEIIEGKNYTVLGLFRKIMTDGAIWSMLGPIKGTLALMTKYALKKKTTNKERKAIIRELDSEIEIVNKKIEYASEDGKMHRKDVYRLMRIKEELENARDRIKDETGVSYRASWYVKDILKKRGGAIR